MIDIFFWYWFAMLFIGVFLYSPGGLKLRLATAALAPFYPFLLIWGSWDRRKQEQVKVNPKPKKGGPNEDLH